MLEGIIWLIIVGAIAYSRAKKAGKIGNAAERKNKPVTYQKTTSQPVKKNFAIMPEHKKVLPNVERKCAAEDGHRSENNVYAKRPAKPTATPNVSRPYTEAPKQTRMEKRGNRIAALRLYEGDHVPQGYRMVRCSYCAAENLIAYSSRGNYMCYFCHEDLQG